MKALKIAATALLTLLLLVSMLAAEAVALAQGTLLEPSFFGENGRGTYLVVGRAVVRKIADAVLERAPVIVLKTTDRQAAWAIAEKALPPERVADILEESGPDIARFLVGGGDIPVLKGSAAFAQGEVDVVKSLLMDGVWDMLPEKPAFPAFMPFTPEWNLGYGPQLAYTLWPLRWYSGMAGQAFWLAVSAAVLFAGLVYFLWIRERKPFCAVMGALLTFNGALLMALAGAAAFAAASVAQGVAGLWPASLAADLFGGDWPALVREALIPFRDIFFVAGAAALSLGIATTASGIESAETAAQQIEALRPARAAAAVRPARKPSGPRHARKN